MREFIKKIKVKLEAWWVNTKVWWGDTKLWWESTKIWEGIKDNWQFLVAGILVGFALIAIIFALPLKTVSTETTEIYYVTEMKEEPYSVQQPYTTEEVHEKTEILIDGLYKIVPGGVVVPFYIDKPDARLVGEFENPISGMFVIIDARNHIIWEKLGSRGTIDYPISEGKYKAKFREDVMWSEDCYILLTMKWSEVEQVTKYKEVTEYREIAVQIEKQRTTIKQDRISIWKHIFN